MSAHTIEAEITGTVWKVLTPVGTSVVDDEPLLIIESMKMEIAVCAPQAGVVQAIYVNEGDAVAEGDRLLLLGL